MNIVLFASIVGKRRSMWIRSLRATVSTSRGEGLLLLLRGARFGRYVGNRVGAVLYLTEEGPEGAVVSNWPGL